jgi:ribonucleoside-diphosphate reductase alpha chain
MDLWVREARLFKYGSGTGSNFSRLRGENEPLSGGGKSSGLMSFLKIGDRAAGAIKSGGTTRRAAKMVVVDIDHPDIENYINWKVIEEQKVAASSRAATGCSTALRGRKHSFVSGQNSNYSARIQFLQAVISAGDGDCGGIDIRQLTLLRASRRNPDRLRRRRLADPKRAFGTALTKLTLHIARRGHQHNPCSEYMFLDDTACNLASLNLVKFLGENGQFDVESFRHASACGPSCLRSRCSWPRSRAGGSPS